MSKKKKRTRNSSSQNGSFEININTDGACVGNPGPMGIGGIICRKGEILTQFSESAGAGTNNEAEYLAIIRALELVKDFALESDKNIRIQSDSQLAINQINGDYTINHAHLARLFSRVKKLLREIPAHVTFSWIRREQNGIADVLASQAAGTPMAVVKDGLVIPWDMGDYQADDKDVNELPKPNPKFQEGVSILLKKGANAKFKDFVDLRTGGLDKYSRAKSEKLAEYIAVRFGPQAMTWLQQAVGDIEEDYGRTVARWVARGLPPDMALKKVSVDKEITTNATRRR